MNTHVLSLPHTHGCLVCGRDNPHGLKLDLSVDSKTGIVSAQFKPGVHLIGFEGIIHGGLLATILDEAMVWSATWACKCFCVCAEMTVRFRQSALVDEKLLIHAKVESQRKIITTTGTLKRADGTLVAEGSGKYMMVSSEKHHDLKQTIARSSQSNDAVKQLWPE